MGGGGFGVRSISPASKGRQPLSGPVFLSVVLAMPSAQGRKELALSEPPMWMVMGPQLNLDRSRMEVGDLNCVSVARGRSMAGSGEDRVTQSSPHCPL